MAGIGKRKSGFYFVRFVSPDGIRRTLAIGTKSERQATLFAAKIENLVVARKSGFPAEAETLTWLAGIKEKFRKTLIRYGVIDSPKSEPQVPMTVGRLIDLYLKGRTDVKPRTLDRMQRSAGHLIECLGRDKLLAEVSAGDVEEMSRHMKKTLGDNTIRRRLSYCKQFFRFAVRKRLLVDNPFADLKNLSVRENRERDYFVSREDASKILEACPNNEWRLIFALARFAGLRIPSELLGLRWSDVNWESERITIRSPKTEHFEGKGTRVIPLFVELKPYLEEAWNQAPEKSDFVVTRCRDEDRNLRTTMSKIIERAGLKVWPKLFQNLRASRATELAGEFPAHVAAEWLGHSALVAQKHYWRTTDSDFEKAIATPSKVSGALHLRSTKSIHRATSDPSPLKNPAEFRRVSQEHVNQYAQQDSNLRPAD